MSSEKKASRGRPGYSREQVVRIAVEEFNRHGYEATSIGKLAERLGVTKSAVYHHIASKEGILVEATSAALDRLEGVLESAEAPGRSSAEVLSEAIRGAVRVLCDLPGEVTLLLRLRGNTDVELEIMDRRRGITREIVSLIAAAQEDGALTTEVDAAVAGRLALGAINSITEWYRPDGRMDPEGLAEAVESIILGGLRRS